MVHRKKECGTDHYRPTARCVLGPDGPLVHVCVIHKGVETEDLAQ